MSALTIEQIVKIVIAIFVLVAVLAGVILAFGNNIIPYFSGIGPSENEPDLNLPYYQELIKDQNLAAITIEKNNLKYIYLKDGASGKEEFVKSDFYFWKDSGEIYRDTQGRWYFVWVNGKDRFAGEIDKRGIIIVDEDYLGELGAIQGAEKIGNEIYLRR